MGQLDNAQTPAGPLSCIPEFPQLVAGQEHTIGVVATFTAPEIRSEGERLPIRLSAVLDKSGSMSGSKLTLVKATTKFMVQQVIETDCVGIVSYDSSVTEDFKVQPVTSALKPELGALIDRIHAGSCTNLSGGLFKGLKQLQEWKEPDVAVAADKKPVYAVFLFTDGQANEGITNPEVLANAVQSNLANFGPGVKIHTFGFGEDHDPSFLGKISEASGGDYYYVKSQEDIPTAFADALGGMLSVSAQNVELTITAASTDVTIEDVSTSFKTEKLGDGSYKIIFGDLFSEERKDVLLTVRVKALTSALNNASPALINLCAKYLDVNEGTFCTRDTVLSVPRPTAAPSEAAAPHPEVVSQRNRVQTAAAMQAAIQAAQQGNMEQARRALAQQAAVLSAMPQNEEAAAMLADVQCQQQMCVDKAVYERVGKKEAATTLQSYNKQRKGVAKSAAVASRNKVQERLVSSSAAVFAPQANVVPQPLLPPAPTPNTNVRFAPNTDVLAPQQQAQPGSSRRGLFGWLSKGKAGTK